MPVCSPIEAARLHGGGLTMKRWSNLMVALTTECSRACPHCCYHVGSAGVDSRPATWAELERFAARVRETVDRVGWLYAGGGEPTLHPDFGRVLREFKAMFRADRLCVQTNGARILEYADQLGDVARVRLTMFPGNRAVARELQPILRDRLILRENKHSEVVGHPGFGQACHSQRPHTVTYWDGRVYRCCMGPGLPEAAWCSVEEMTVERVASLEMACYSCPFARSSTEVEFRELHEGGWTWSPPWPNEWWVGRARWVADRVSEWEDVLDLGCGRAGLAGVLRASGHRGLYYGVDHDEELLDEAFVGLNAAGIGDGVGVQLLEGDLEHYDVGELLRREWHYVGSTSLAAEPPVVVLSAVLERLGDPLRLLRTIPAGVKVVALVEQPLFARSKCRSAGIYADYEPLFDDFEAEQVVDCGESGGISPGAARGWAYGFTGVRR